MYNYFGFTLLCHPSVRGRSLLYFCSFLNPCILENKKHTYFKIVRVFYAYVVFLKHVSSTFLNEICLVLSSSFHFSHDQLVLVYSDPNVRNAIAQFKNLLHFANVIDTIQIYNNSIND